jgi:hypothetical protein
MAVSRIVPAILAGKTYVAVAYDGIGHGFRLACKVPDAGQADNKAREGRPGALDGVHERFLNPLMTVFGLVK